VRGDCTEFGAAASASVESPSITFREDSIALACIESVIMTQKDIFRRFAHQAACHVGSPAAFFLSVVVISVWAVTGPFFGYSDTWQLIINTGTTIVTFLMVFLIQNTQNRDALAMQLKLDELIRAVAGARNRLVDLEDLSDEELERLKTEFRDLSHEGVLARIESARQRRRLRESEEPRVRESSLVDRR
jgi:low affinity Fe/Cu permease